MRIPLASPVFDDKMKKAAVDALCSERFVLGESVYKLEEEFAKYCGVAFAGTCFVPSVCGLMLQRYVKTAKEEFRCRLSSARNVDKNNNSGDTTISCSENTAL